MKKIFLIIIVIISLLLTGCSKNKSLNCSTNISQDGLKIYYNITVNFEKNIATDFKMNGNVKVDEKNINHTKAIASNLDKTLKEQYVQIKKYNYSFETIDNEIKFKLESKNSDFQLSVDNKYNSIKKQLENNGFTCE